MWKHANGKCKPGDTGRTLTTDTQSSRSNCCWSRLALHPKVPHNMSKMYTLNVGFLLNYYSVRVFHITNQLTTDIFFSQNNSVNTLWFGNRRYGKHNTLHTCFQLPNALCCCSAKIMKTKKKKYNHPVACSLFDITPIRFSCSNNLCMCTFYTRIPPTWWWFLLVLLFDCQRVERRTGSTE